MKTISIIVAQTISLGLTMYCISAVLANHLYYLIGYVLTFYLVFFFFISLVYNKKLINQVFKRILISFLMLVGAIGIHIFLIQKFDFNKSDGVNIQDHEFELKKEKMKRQRTNELNNVD